MGFVFYGGSVGVKQLVANFLNLDWLNTGGGSLVVPTSPSATPYYGDSEMEATQSGNYNIPGGGTANPFSWLGYFLATGRQMHDPISDAFVGYKDSGYYHYERRRNWLTCAVAAAYAGAFGAESIEEQRLSPSLVKWRLGHLIGVDLDTVTVTGPTGRTQPVLDEMISLMDTDGWSRAGIAEWLYSQGGQ